MRNEAEVDVIWGFLKTLSRSQALLKVNICLSFQHTAWNTLSKLAALNLGIEASKQSEVTSSPELLLWSLLI